MQDQGSRNLRPLNGEDDDHTGPIHVHGLHSVATVLSAKKVPLGNDMVQEGTLSPEAARLIMELRLRLERNLLSTHVEEWRGQQMELIHSILQIVSVADASSELPGYDLLVRGIEDVCQAILKSGGISISESEQGALRVSVSLMSSAPEYADAKCLFTVLAALRKIAELLQVDRGRRTAYEMRLREFRAEETSILDKIQALHPTRDSVALTKLERVDLVRCRKEIAALESTQLPNTERWIRRDQQAARASLGTYVPREEKTGTDRPNADKEKQKVKVSELELLKMHVMSLFSRGGLLEGRLSSEELSAINWSELLIHLTFDVADDDSLDDVSSTFSERGSVSSGPVVRTTAQNVVGGRSISSTSSWMSTRKGHALGILLGLLAGTPDKVFFASGDATRQDSSMMTPYRLRQNAVVSDEMLDEFLKNVRSNMTMSETELRKLTPAQQVALPVLMSHVAPRLRSYVRMYYVQTGRLPDSKLAFSFRGDKERPNMHHVFMNKVWVETFDTDHPREPEEISIR